MINTILISLSIFVSLFLCLWQLDQKEKRMFSLLEYDTGLEEIIHINNELEKTFQTKTKAFQSREYVRVKRIL